MTQPLKPWRLWCDSLTTVQIFTSLLIHFTTMWTMCTRAQWYSNIIRCTRQHQHCVTLLIALTIYTHCFLLDLKLALLNKERATLQHHVAWKSLPANLYTYVTSLVDSWLLYTKYCCTFKSRERKLARKQVQLVIILIGRGITRTIQYLCVNWGVELIP